MTVTINGSGTITGVTTMGTTVVNQTLTTPTITSTMGVGNATPAASGAGITFPATQSASTDANTLDDYEEGTWTCTLTGSGFTASPQPAYYRKIGSQVTVWVNYDNQLTLNAGSGSTGLTITGLPFTCTANNSCSGAVGLRSSINTDYYYIGNASATISLYYKSGNAWSRSTGADVTAAAYIGITATYYV